jgi:hypothetical protein
MTDRQDKLDEIRQLQARIDELERDVRQISAGEVWTPPQYYAAYEIMGGMVLGLIGAGASLLFNVVGASALGKHPLELIRVYLTFPLGASALTLENGFALSAGICLYLMTGMVGGIPIHLILGRWFGKASGFTRFAVATVLGLGVWLVNFYGLLSWLQPLLIGGHWIVERIPWWVAASTHLVFAWTMLAVNKWGVFVPYEPRRKAGASGAEG